MKCQQEGRARLGARFKNYFSIVARAMSGRDQGHNLFVGWPPADHGGKIMKTLTSAQLFAAPKKAHSVDCAVRISIIADAPLYSSYAAEDADRPG